MQHSSLAYPRVCSHHSVHSRAFFLRFRILQEALVLQVLADLKGVMHSGIFFVSFHLGRWITSDDSSELITFFFPAAFVFLPPSPLTGHDALKLTTLRFLAIDC